MTHHQFSIAQASPALEEAVVALGQVAETPARPKLVSSPILRAIRNVGTAHIYADTADVEELKALLSTDDGAIISEVDGNTVNQPLVHKVLRRVLEEGKASKWATTLKAQYAELTPKDLLPLLYAIICGRIGNRVLGALAAGRAWEVSLQLHMGLTADPEAAKKVGRSMRRMVPTAFVKVPFAPHAPHCFLVARDLEREGIPVNFTSTFSARQVVAAGLLADVTRTNIFMGRLDQGLQAELLGAQVDLSAQRALTQLRGSTGIKTQLIVASMRNWWSFIQTAGCDIYTAPVQVIRDLLQQPKVRPDEIRSQLDTTYEARLGISTEVLAKLSPQRIAALYRIDPAFIEFLKAYRASAEYQDLKDGDRLARRFEEAGFGDFFYAPTAAEWAELRRGKLPDLDAPLTARLPLDTLYSLLADADFEKYQEEMDREIEQRLQG